MISEIANKPSVILIQNAFSVLEKYINHPHIVYGKPLRVIDTLKEIQDYIANDETGAANMLAAILVVSSGVTLINKSAFLIPASSNSLIDVGLPTIGRISILEFVKFKRSSLGSIKMMSCFSCDNILAKCVPTSPAPAIMIFI